MQPDPAELGSHAIFGGLSPDELEQVARRLHESHFEPGEEVVREGEPARSMYLIYSGAAEVLKRLPGEHGEQRLSSLAAGDCFGEMALIDIQPRSATVRALETTITWSISNADLHSLREWRTETFAMIVMNIAREISRRLRRSDSLAAEFLFGSGKTRCEAPSQAGRPG